jgi:hypothetical protein
MGVWRGEVQFLSSKAIDSALDRRLPSVFTAFYQSIPCGFADECNSGTGVHKEDRSNCTSTKRDNHGKERPRVPPSDKPIQGRRHDGRRVCKNLTVLKPHVGSDFAECHNSFFVFTAFIFHVPKQNIQHGMVDQRGSFSAKHFLPKSGAGSCYSLFAGVPICLFRLCLVSTCPGVRREVESLCLGPILGNLPNNRSIFHSSISILILSDDKYV